MHIDPAARRAYFDVMDPKHTAFGVGVIVAGLAVNAWDSVEHPLSEPPIGLAGLPVHSTVSTLHWAPMAYDAIAGEEIPLPAVEGRPTSLWRR